MSVSNDILSSVEDLRKSSKRSVPITLTVAMLAILSFGFTIWTVWSSNARIGEYRDDNSKLQQKLAMSEQNNQDLQGQLKAIKSRSDLSDETASLISDALKEAQTTGDQISAASAAAQQQAAAVDKIVSGKAKSTDQSIYASKTTKAGDSQGWNIDIFWCVSPKNENQSQKNERFATEDATALSDIQRISGGERVGRVRVRPLSSELQGKGYPNAGSGISIRPENNASEQSFAKNLADLLRSNSQREYRIDRSNTPTKWYMSVFVCT